MWRYLILKDFVEVKTSGFDFLNQEGALQAAGKYFDSHDPRNEQGWHVATEHRLGRERD
jgi:hypothetical protein